MGKLIVMALIGAATLIARRRVSRLAVIDGHRAERAGVPYTLDGPEIL
jgi:hypothetical protein